MESCSVPVKIRLFLLQINCSSDASLVADPSQLIKHCGEKRKPLILSYSNCDSLTLNFVSDPFQRNGRFLFRYAITSAGKWSTSWRKVKVSVIHRSTYPIIVFKIHASKPTVHPSIHPSIHP